jgi:hypothetical protein
MQNSVIMCISSHIKIVPVCYSPANLVSNYVESHFSQILVKLKTENTKGNQLWISQLPDSEK